MFKVIIALEEAGSSENLAEACHIYISKMKEMVKNGQASAYVVYEACIIEAEIEGETYMMNFDAIVDFSHEIGILDNEGRLVEKPVPVIPIELARDTIIAANNASFEAWLVENAPEFQLILAPDSCANTSSSWYLRT